MLKPIVRIDKSSLRSLIGKLMNYETPYRYILHRNKDVCSSCEQNSWHEKLVAGIKQESDQENPDMNKLNILHKELESLDDHCKNCSACQVEKKYQNEKVTYQYYKKQYDMKRLPKTAVKLYILLFSVPMERMGQIHIIRDIPIKALAAKLNVNKITVRRSLNLLKSNELITVSHGTDKNHYNIIVHAYDTMHLKGREGGSGYITIKADAVETILSIHNVNSLRLELLKLLELDNISRSEEDNSNSLKIKEVKKVLPDHLNYQNKYTVLQTDMPSIFQSYVSESTIFYTLKNEYPIKIDLEKVREESKKKIVESLHENKISTTDLEVLDIIDLTTQYPIKLILQAIAEIKKSYIEKTISILNLPALTRTITNQIYHNTLAA
jgi:Bacterial regulatory proteins, gntR family.